MKLTEKINFRQPKYMLPAILYIPILFFGFFIIRLFWGTEKADVDKNKLETTEFYNDKLPDANIKGDGIGDKYTNMLNDFGKIKDESAVENIERGGDDIKEEYTSQYSDAEVAALDQNSSQAQQSLERLKQLQEQMRQQQAQDNSLTNDRTGGNTSEEDETLESLRQALNEARQAGRQQMTGSVDRAENASGEAGQEARQRLEAETKGEVKINEKAVSEISEEAEAEEVVKKQKETSDYFNTITTNEPEHKLIKAIVDEDIKVTDGSRVRLRLLDDIDVGDRTITKGSYLYCTMSGFSQQRIKGTVKSVLVNDELVKVNLSIYDTDGMEGLYVPKSSFRETTQDVASGAMSQSMSLNDGSSTTSMGRWGMQALQNAYQKTANAISKNIRKNKVKVKYGTQVYLINSKEKRKEQR
jgi:conjugative transposon TraM protein